MKLGWKLMMRKLSVRRLAIRFGFLVMLLMAGLFVIRSSSDAPNFPAEGGAKSFAACPESPNCVSTQAASLDHQMKPVPCLLYTSPSPRD